MSEQSDFVLRVASASDLDVVVEHVLFAGGGLYEALFLKLLPPVALRAALKMSLGQDNGGFYYRNAVLAEDAAGKTLGCVLSYWAEQYGPPKSVMSLLPQKTRTAYGDFLTESVPNSMYLHALSVLSEARGSGVGRLLIDFVIALAEDSRANGVSLHVRGENAVARSLYDSMGFVPVKSFWLPPANSQGPDEEMILVHRPTGGQ